MKPRRDLGFAAGAAGGWNAPPAALRLGFRAHEPDCEGKASTVSVDDARVEIDVIDHFGQAEITGRPIGSSVRQDALVAAGDAQIRESFDIHRGASASVVDQTDEFRDGWHSPTGTGFGGGLQSVFQVHLRALPLTFSSRPMHAEAASHPGQLRLGVEYLAAVRRQTGASRTRASGEYDLRHEGHE